MGIEEPSQFRRVRLLSSKQLSLFKPRCRAGPLSKKARAAAKAIRKIAALDASLNGRFNHSTSQDITNKR